METPKKSPERKDIANAMDWSIPELVGGIATRQAMLGSLTNAPHRTAEVQRDISLLDFELQMKRTEAYHAQQGEQSA